MHTTIKKTKKKLNNITLDIMIKKNSNRQKQKLRAQIILLNNINYFETQIVFF